MKYHYQILSFLLLNLVFSCTSKKILIIDHTSSEISYSGRMDTSDEHGKQMYWSGSSIKINFEGSSISALLEDEKGDNYFNVIIDDDSLFILRPDTTKRYYQLATNLSKGKHSLEIFKRTEWERGSTNFYEFKLFGNAKVLPRPSIDGMKLEFYGNSITAGYAVEDTSGMDSPDSTYTNNFVSYAALTARHFDAEYQCICRSGIGIMVSWFPLIMPEMYDRLDPRDPDSQWDFSLYDPDIVVVNLMQNDSWIVNMKGSEEFSLRFDNMAPDDIDIIRAYQQFIEKLRAKYPHSDIICSLGCMDAAKKGSKWIDYIKTAVNNLNDPSIHTHIMPYIEASAHPSVKDQEVMANSLIGFIQQNLK